MKISVLIVVIPLVWADLLITPPFKTREDLLKFILGDPGNSTGSLECEDYNNCTVRQHHAKIIRRHVVYNFIKIIV